METTKIASDLPDVSKLCLGTWAMGGWLWGGCDNKESIATIHKAIDLGINFIDTAPVYGFGNAESVVGDAIKAKGNRADVVIATKAGLEWSTDEKVFRNSDSKRLKSELEDSLKRLQTDYIDLYQVHWPDDLVPVEETAQVMAGFVKAGKVRAVGVSNYSVEQMERFKTICPIHTSQPPYNLFERGIEADVLPFSNRNHVTTLAYGAICRGLLSGRMKADTKFEGDDLRNFDPKFAQPRFSQYLEAVAQLEELAQTRHDRHVIHLAVNWILQQGQTIALVGARRPEQLDVTTKMTDWQLSKQDLSDIDQILTETVKDPIGPEFMQSPNRSDTNYTGPYPV
jgi:aryl-alcohol dehydrogenase-like predicted oxidoreductase